MRALLKSRQICSPAASGSTSAEQNRRQRAIDVHQAGAAGSREVTNPGLDGYVCSQQGPARDDALARPLSELRSPA